MLQCFDVSQHQRIQTYCIKLFALLSVFTFPCSSSFPPIHYQNELISSRIFSCSTGGGDSGQLSAFSMAHSCFRHLLPLYGNNQATTKTLLLLHQLGEDPGIFLVIFPTISFSFEFSLSSKADLAAWCHYHLY